MLEDCDDEAFLAYKNDSRMPCRYGAKCYQKNPLHHNKYKHPPSNKKKIERWNQKQATGSKRKVEEIDAEEKSEGSSVPSKIQKTNTDPPATVEDESECITDNADADVTCLDNPLNDKEEIANLEEEIKEEKESPKSFNNGDREDDDSRTILSPDSMVENISNLFLVKMPEDFYKFYEFCELLSKDNPSTALKSIRLYLVGPYDLLSCKLKSFRNSDKEKYLRHWRYYYDPPEFQTVIRGDKDGFHLGYWRDDLNEKPVFVVKNKANVNCIIEPIAENIFGAVNVCIEEAFKQANLFEKPSISQLQKKIKEFAQERNISLERKTDNMKSREKQVVARAFHKAGIVVPYNKKTQLGYRELAVTDKDLHKVLKDINEASSSETRRKAMSKLDEVVRLATIAADECDFGTCLELAHDLFSSGVVYVEKIALQMFSIAYTNLDRPGFLEIAKAHLKDRKRGTDLSVIE